MQHAPSVDMPRLEGPVMSPSWVLAYERARETPQELSRLPEVLTAALPVEGYLALTRRSFRSQHL